jgi:hypothetical protein
MIDDDDMAFRLRATWTEECSACTVRAQIESADEVLTDFEMDTVTITDASVIEKAIATTKP